MGKTRYIEFAGYKQSQTNKIHLPISSYRPSDVNVLGQYTAYRAPNPDGVIHEKDGIVPLLSEPLLVVERQLNAITLWTSFVGRFRYVIKNQQGLVLGFIEERQTGFKGSFTRQVMKRSRPFDFDVFDNQGILILVIRRGLKVIRSNVQALLPNNAVIGESSEKIHPLKRKYRLFQTTGVGELTQFGSVSAPPLSFDFSVADERGFTIGAVDRFWAGIGREVLERNSYVLRMDPLAFQGVTQHYSEVQGALTLDQRAVLLATMVSVDLDYFTSENE